MWRSWAGVITRGLRLWGRLDVLPNSLKRLWRRLMVEKMNIQFTATALVDIPAVSMLIARSSKLATSVALCCVIKMHILEWPFIVASLRHTCAIIMLSNQHLDMPNLWGGMDYLGKGEVLTNTDLDRLWTIFERNRPFVYIEKVLDLWVQLMKNGGKNKSVAFIILVSVWAALEGCTNKRLTPLTIIYFLVSALCLKHCLFDHMVFSETLLWNADVLTMCALYMLCDKKCLSQCEVLFSAPLLVCPQLCQTLATTNKCTPLVLW